MKPATKSRSATRCFFCHERAKDPEDRHVAVTVCTRCRSQINEKPPATLKQRDRVRYFEVTGAPAYLLATASESGYDIVGPLTDSLADLLRRAMLDRYGVDVHADVELAREKYRQGMKERRLHFLDLYNATRTPGERTRLAKALAEDPEVFASVAAVKQAAAERRHEPKSKRLGGFSDLYQFPAGRRPTDDEVKERGKLVALHLQHLLLEMQVGALEREAEEGRACLDLLSVAAARERLKK